MASVCASVVALPVAAAHVAAAPRRGSLAPMPLAKVANQWESKTVSNGVTTTAMLVWQPENNKFFETLSFLPPLSNAEIGKQIDYITNNGWIPCLEFADAKQSYIDSASTIRMGNCGSNYYDNRYWTMYKLPMFGCTDSSVVIKEIGNCIKSFPDAYIRIVAFDNLRQVQCAGFLVHRPKSANDFRAPSERSA